VKLNFCSLSSGSSGNCYYLGNEFYGILIDAGISATSIRKFLKNMNISMQTIMGVMVTHNHIDREIVSAKFHYRKNFILLVLISRHFRFVMMLLKQ
jgi:glyoxylase-like metal-dependent hydrolase (beta-lactamase superfamily II)